MSRRGSNLAPIQTFLIISTCVLYLVAAGLFSRGIWAIESDAVRSRSTDLENDCDIDFVSGTGLLVVMQLKVVPALDHMIFGKAYGT